MSINGLWLLSEIYVSASSNNYWKSKLSEGSRNIHLAIMREPYLSFILNGSKTIESRFTLNKIDPYGNISTGDIIILKKSAGAIEGIFEAGAVVFVRADSEDDIHKVRQNFGSRLLVSDEFWEKKVNSRYVTLIEVRNLLAIKPIVVSMKNRRSWFLLGTTDNLRLNCLHSDENAQ